MCQTTTNHSVSCASAAHTLTLAPALDKFRHHPINSHVSTRQQPSRPRYPCFHEHKQARHRICNHAVSMHAHSATLAPKFMQTHVPEPAIIGSSRWANLVVFHSCYRSLSGHHRHRRVREHDITKTDRGVASWRLLGRLMPVLHLRHGNEEEKDGRREEGAFETSRTLSCVEWAAGPWGGL